MKRESLDRCLVELDLIALVLGDAAAPAPEHLAHCPSCAARLGQYRRLWGLLDRADPLALAPDVQVAPVAYGTVPSPVGPLQVAVTDQGVVALEFGEDRAAFLADLRARVPQPLAEDPEALRPVVDELRAYFGQERRDFACAVDLRGVKGFQREVLEALRQVPYGQVVSYGELARRIGKPGASRAVGSALGRNPIPIIVPCHRVVASGGRIGGYTGGLAIKRHLLTVEGVHLMGV